MKAFFLFAFTVFSLGCATTAHQTESLLRSTPAELKRSSEIVGVPFINQTTGYCGPATLAMVMNWHQRHISVDELAPQVFTPGMKGTFQTDMVSATRRNGMMAVQIEGLDALLTEVTAGHPVIVFENLALTWAPQYHYAVVYGYDLDKEIVIMHSGPEAGKRWDMRKFERSWMLGDYWGLVVLPPGALATAAGELAHVTAAAGLEQISKNSEAEKSYLAIIERWPTSLGALIGLGNVTYARKDYKNSVRYLKRALAAHPESVPAKHNLKVAEEALKRASR